MLMLYPFLIGSKFTGGAATKTRIRLTVIPVIKQNIEFVHGKRQNHNLM